MDDMQRRGQSERKRGIAAGTAAFLLTVIGLVGLMGIAWAAAPTLTEVTGQELPKTFQANKNYTLSLNYKDPNDDDIKKAVFVDESDAGRVTTTAPKVSGSTSQGVVLTWDVRNLAQGAHRSYFEVTSVTGTTRFPKETTEFYTFGVEALATKLGLMGVGLVVGLVGVPLLVYLITRATNKRGNPSSAARLGLLIGILACCALFIYLFANVYGPLVYAILIIGGLAALVLLLTRR